MFQGCVPTWQCSGEVKDKRNAGDIGRITLILVVGFRILCAETLLLATG